MGSCTKVLAQKSCSRVRSPHPPLQPAVGGGVEQQCQRNFFVGLPSHQRHHRDLPPELLQARGGHATCDRVVGLGDVAHTGLVAHVHSYPCHAHRHHAAGPSSPLRISHGRVVGTSDFRFVLRSIVYLARGTSRSFCERFEIIVVSRRSICESLANSSRLSFVPRTSASATDRNSAFAVCATSALSINAQLLNQSAGILPTMVRQ